MHPPAWGQTRPRALLRAMMAYVSIPVSFALRPVIQKQLAASYYHPMASPGTGRLRAPDRERGPSACPHAPQRMPCFSFHRNNTSLPPIPVHFL